MLRRLHLRLTYANVVSTICLFLVLGGGAAYAATHLPKNSVGTKQLKNGAVTKQKISASALASLTGAQGPKGDPGSATGGGGGPAIVARASGSSTVQSSGPPYPTYPLTGGTWTQAADEDELIVGSVTISASPSFSKTGTTGCDYSTGHGLVINIAVNGEPVASEDSVRSSPVSFTMNLPSDSGNPFATGMQMPLILSTGSTRTDTLEIYVGDDCWTSDHYTVSAMRLHVIGFR